MNQLNNLERGFIREEKKKKKLKLIGTDKFNKHFASILENGRKIQSCFLVVVSDIVVIFRYVKLLSCFSQLLVIGKFENVRLEWYAMSEPMR